MKTEKLILSFVAAVFGLIVAGAVFYLFQAAKTIPAAPEKTVSLISPAPTPMPSVFLTLDRPKDEEVVGSKILVISGKTSNDAVIVVIANSLDDVITPSGSGNFSTTINLDDGQNILEVIAIAPNGESVRSKKTVTYSLEEF